MKRIDYIRAMTAKEMAEKIRDIENLKLDEYCKSDCEASKDWELDPDESECIKCCIKWLQEEDASFVEKVWKDR